MAGFNPVTPNAQLGLTNIVGNVKPPVSPFEVMNSQLAANQQRAMNAQGMEMNQQSMDLRASADQRAQQAAGREQATFEQKQYDQLVQEAAMVYGSASASGATPEVIRGMLRNKLRSSNLSADQKAQLEKQLDSPQGFATVISELDTIYRNLPSELQAAKATAKTKAGAAGGVKLGMSETFKKKDPKTGKVVTAFADTKSGRHIGPGGIDVSSWDNVTTEEDRKKALYERDIKNAGEYYNTIFDEAMVDREEALNTIADVDTMNALREQTSTGSWTGAEDFVSSILQGFGYTNDEQGVRQALDQVSFNFARANFDAMKGAISNVEFKRLQEVAPNLKMTPQGLTISLDLKRQYAEWQQKRAKFIMEDLDDSEMTRAQMATALAEWENANPMVSRDKLLEAIKLGSENPNYRQTTFKSFVKRIMSQPNDLTGDGTPGSSIPDDMRMTPIEKARNELNRIEYAPAK